MEAQGFPRAARLLKAAEFAALRGGQRLACRHFHAEFRSNALASCRLGLAVSKRVSKRAVQRNRLKRLARESFRRWFTALAELQFYRLSAQWNAEQRDCAGLVRFAWREALRKHDRLWFQSINEGGEGVEPVAPDMRAYTLDRSPVGEKLFRTEFGSFVEADLTNGKLSEFADARTLKNYNTTFISRDWRQAQAGDLVFFHQPWVQKYPYHVMIFLGEARHVSAGAHDWVVYHTGASPEDEGEVKKVRLAVLEQHPDRRWRPVAGNKNFLGFYRLKILQ
mgnify:CR=1 FL=1